MGTIKVDVVWSPINPDKFITFGNELRLFHVDNVSDLNLRNIRKSAVIKLSDSTYASLLAINSDINFIRCVSVYPKHVRTELDVLLAVGQSSGKITLASFGQSNLSSNLDPSHLIGTEYTPKHARHCNSLDWNPVESNLLAAGLEKQRADYGTIIWDINKVLDFKSSDSTRRSNVNYFRPIHEIGIGESTYSLQWFTNERKTLACGMNNKHIRIYDLRNNTIKQSHITNSKAVYGLTIDPHNNNRLASFSENHVYLYDLRNFDKPLVTIQEQKAISKVSWCPTRSNSLAILTKESSIIKLYNIQQGSTNDSFDYEPTLTDRTVQPLGSQNVSSFAWHPNHELRMLIINAVGSPKDFAVTDRITLNWSPVSEIIWTRGKKVLQSIDSSSEVYKKVKDISLEMRERALNDYGLKRGNEKEYIPNDEKLLSLWHWIKLTKRLEKQVFKANDSSNKLFGIRHLIKPSTLNSENMNNIHKRSESHLVQWMGLEYSKNNNMLTYRSEERNKALLLCEWRSDLDNINDVLKLIENLESNGHFSRAAGIAVFNMRLKRGIQALAKGATTEKEYGGDPNLSGIAMALSGYTGERSLWRESCKSLRYKLEDPYLKAIFNFLTCESDRYDEILEDQKLKLSDRIAFACTFLSDVKLQEYLDYLSRKLIKAGDMDGLLLVGVTKEGLDLLQHYIEATSDVQTVSFILLHSLPSPIHLDPRAMHWVEQYKELLDTWCLWHKRCLFQIQWYKRLSSEALPPQQLFISCNFCGKSISSSLASLSSSRGINNTAQGHYGRVSVSAAATNKTRIGSCPGCRKPLPRCALCLSQLGTPAGLNWSHWRGMGVGVDGGVHAYPRNKLSPFKNWFSWCMSCRHGGHANHLQEWFKENLECPVTGCTCKCMSLDAVIKN